MGCTSSKRVETTVAADVYRPSATSYALFDVNAIEEPWLVNATQQFDQHNYQKPSSQVPTPILEKLHTFELAADGPHSWSEVSKALEDLKPSEPPPTPPPTTATTPPPAHVSKTNKSNPLTKNHSFHTLEELDAKLTVTHCKPDRRNLTPPARPPDSASFKPLSQNIFIVRDRLEKGDSGRRIGRRDALSEYPEKCPPGGCNSVVLYTTTLRGVRRTFEDCKRAREIIEGHRVALDERDVALHGEFLNELRELVGGEGESGVPSVPRLFVKGRYVGGVDEVVKLNELGRLGELLDSVGIGRGLGRKDCEGCGGVRFVPCLECSGSCKVFDGAESKMVRCGKCNENGLVHCPLCCY
eukprot:TRINITY_DN974_c0_g1_i1.p1 TRINITY_DN974_c0_g1~~TRINITY_DN974_c0_g1_i1.p1  ORF type:complete len:355 (+),score=19.90 TRINITY_DN974_c0_g1_i1:103-1167(+)